MSAAAGQDLEGLERKRRGGFITSAPADKKAPKKSSRSSQNSSSDMNRTWFRFGISRLELLSQISRGRLNFKEKKEETDEWMDGWMDGWMDDGWIKR